MFLLWVHQLVVARDLRVGSDGPFELWSNQAHLGADFCGGAARLSRALNGGRVLRQGCFSR